MFNQDILKFGLYCILSYLMLICIIGLALIAYSPTPQKAEKVSVLSQILSGLLLLQMRVFHMFESWIVASSIYLYINSDKTQIQILAISLMIILLLFIIEVLFSKLFNLRVKNTNIAWA